jgi:hypothetical protein
MKKLTLATLAVVALATACPPKADEATSLPPAGLAGAPSTGTAGAVAVDPSSPLPAGHPPIDNPHGGATVAGGNDGAPLSPKEVQAPLPNLPGMNGGGGDMGGGMGGNVVFAGKVLEKLDVPQYTYLRIQTSSGEEWVAVSTMQVNVGDSVTVNQQLVMENFASKSLGRTFPKLVMGSATIGG